MVPVIVLVTTVRQFLPGRVAPPTVVPAAAAPLAFAAVLLLQLFLMAADTEGTISSMVVIVVLVLVGLPMLVAGMLLVFGGMVPLPFSGPGPRTRSRAAFAVPKGWWDGAMHARNSFEGWCSHSWDLYFSGREIPSVRVRGGRPGCDIWRSVALAHCGAHGVGDAVLRNLRPGKGRLRDQDHRLR
jgi:hypothetical protein